MKTLFIVLVLAFASLPILRAEGGSDYKPKSRVVFETFTSKVIKVLSFEDGDAEYSAFVVSWKNHEVVVLSNVPMGKSPPKYKVGDEVTCFLAQRYSMDGGSTKATLSFSLQGSPEVGPTAQDEARRLQAIAAEVRARREAREAGQPVAAPPSP